jgi:hypothetical protein
MRSSNILDQMLRSNQISNSPARSVEQLSSTAYSQRKSRDLRAQRRHASERHVVQLIVHFVGQDENLVLDAKVANGLQLGAAEYLAHGVMRRVNHNHARALCDLALQLLHVERPLAGGSRLCCAVGGRVQRDVDDFAAGHFDVGDVLVEERLEDDNFVAGLKETHES